MSNPFRPHGLYSPWNSPVQNTGVGGRSLLQGIFPAQGSPKSQSDSLPAELPEKPLFPQRWIFFKVQCPHPSPKHLSIQLKEQSLLGIVEAHDANMSSDTWEGVN